jgi:hypothetical protein
VERELIYPPTITLPDGAPGDIVRHPFAFDFPEAVEFRPESLAVVVTPKQTGPGWQSVLLHWTVGGEPLPINLVVHGLASGAEEVIEIHGTVRGAGTPPRGAGTQGVPAQQNRVTVREDGGGDYPTIAAAVLAVPDGTEIVVGPGMYREQLVLGRGLTISGEGGRDNVILDGPRGECVKISNGSATVRGITVWGGGDQPAVEVAGAAQLTIVDCDVISTRTGARVTGTAELRAVQSSFKDSPKGVFVDSGKFLAEDCSFFQCRESALYLKGGVTRIRGSEFSSNSQGVDLRAGSLNVEDSELSRNGFAVWAYISEADAIFRRCTFKGGQQRFYVTRSKSISVIACTFANGHKRFELADGAVVRELNNTWK